MVKINLKNWDKNKRKKYPLKSKTEGQYCKLRLSNTCLSLKNTVKVVILQREDKKKDYPKKKKKKQKICSIPPKITRTEISD